MQNLTKIEYSLLCPLLYLYNHEMDDNEMDNMEYGSIKIRNKFTTKIIDDKLQFDSRRPKTAPANF